MRLKMENEKFIDLISKQLTGNISQEESAELAALLNESQENRALLESLKSKWIHSANYKPTIIANTQKSWEQFSAKVKLDIPLAKQKQRWIQTTWVRVAAMLVISIGVSFYLGTSNSGKSFTTTKGQELNIQLPDGTKVRLEELSSLSYDKNYNKINREVNLKGLGYFDVVKDSLKPFIVQNETTEVRVLGTSFSVDAYTVKRYVEVIVRSGKVSFLEKIGMRNTVLTKGMKASYNILTKTLIANKSSGGDSEIQLVGELKFEDTSLSNILIQLETNFGKQFTLSNENIGSCKFTGSFISPTLNEVIEVLSASLNIHISQQGNSYNVEGEGCH
jgi:transmembrane sensor